MALMPRNAVEVEPSRRLASPCADPRATDADLPAFVPFFREIVDAGETYAYPEDLSDAQISGACGSSRHRGAP